MNLFAYYFLWYLADRLTNKQKNRQTDVKTEPPGAGNHVTEFWMHLQMICLMGRIWEEVIFFSFQSLAIEKLHSCDDAFRKQLEKQKEVYEREIDRLTREKEEVIDQSNQKVGTQVETKVSNKPLIVQRRKKFMNP